MTRQSVARLTVVTALALLLTGVGCNSFRCQVGVGLGAGALVKIPGFSHIGLCHGQFSHVGCDYGRGWCSGERFKGRDWLWECSSLVFYHEENFVTPWVVVAIYDDGTAAKSVRNEFTDLKHNCYMILPPVFGSTRGDDDIYGNWSLEIVIMVLLADIRLGFNPTYISQSVRDVTVW